MTPIRNRANVPEGMGEIKKCSKRTIIVMGPTDNKASFNFGQNESLKQFSPLNTYLLNIIYDF